MRPVPDRFTQAKCGFPTTLRLTLLNNSHQQQNNSTTGCECADTPASPALHASIRFITLCKDQTNGPWHKSTAFPLHSAYGMYSIFRGRPPQNVRRELALSPIDIHRNGSSKIRSRSLRCPPGLKGLHKFISFFIRVSESVEASETIVIWLLLNLGCIAPLEGEPKSFASSNRIARALRILQPKCHH